jgi:hypothetical protein
MSGYLTGLQAAAALLPLLLPVAAMALAMAAALRANANLFAAPRLGLRHLIQRHQPLQKRGQVF